MSYIKQVYPSTAINTTTTVFVQRIPVEHYERFCLHFKNANTAIAFLNMQVQAAINTTADSQASVAQDFVDVNTGIIPVPSALGPTASVLTSGILNCYRYLRIIGHTSQTAGATTVTVTVGGFRRRD